jgi:hypothetical protein
LIEIPLIHWFLFSHVHVYLTFLST